MNSFFKKISGLRYFQTLIRHPGQGLAPPRALALSFAALIILGALGLLTPGMATTDLAFVDALFTSTSAVCVTGLVVLDTGRDFSLPGQLLILALIQLGGLGIMTFSVLLYKIMGRQTSMRDELAVRDSLSFFPAQDFNALVKTVFFWTFAIEGAGALLLFVFFQPALSTGQAAYAAVFHSISAFCNAGFSLWTDSLTAFQTNLGVNLVIITLITAGGLGFIVLAELGRFRSKNISRLSLHSLIVLSTSLALVVVGTLAFLALEWNNVLRSLPWNDKLIVSLFQAVTPRTAGFNTVDFNHLTNASILITIMLMFIGGSPGGAAGGVKTVALAIILAMAVSRYRGFSKVNIFRRGVPDGAVSRGLTVVMVSLGVVLAALALVLTIQTGGNDHTQTRDAFIRLLFETVSAFGTVGLSMGATAELTVWGKLVIIGTMFLGRVGPLTVVLALTHRAGEGKAFNYGTEEIMVG
ncbi:MAG: TrkH family potassium uptake protein [Pseudomonadota bacterium]